MTGNVLPAWLEAPSECLKRPPVRSRAQGLPFEELGWSDFERLVPRVVRADRTIADCEVYGIPGQVQHGIDLLAALVSAPADKGCFQCKKVESFGVADVKKAVAKFEGGRWAQQAREFTVCVASSLESTEVVEAIAQERTRLAARGIRFAIWDGSKSGDLNVRLKGLPEIVDDFFGREWVNVFNGEEAAARLGERLDGIDFNGLRMRLAELYATIFAQHDPGLRVEVMEPIDYLERYVPADVLEKTTLEGLGQGVSKQDSAASLSNAGSGEHRQHDESRPVARALEAFSARRPAWEWLRDQDSCVILGEPGHGKSALLRQLALALAKGDFAEGAPMGSAHLHRLPVWLSFARAAAAIAEDSNTSIEDVFCRWLHQYGYADVQPLFRRALRTSELVLLVDGLDEAASDTNAREALDRIITFGRSHRAILICTSRPRSFSALPVPTAWPNATLAPLNDDQIMELATRWFAVLEGSARAEPAEARRARSRPRGEAFLDAVKANPRTQELARNPLLCQALIEMFRLSHRLPEARVRAYADIIDLFLRRHPQARAHAGFAPRPTTLEDIRDTDLKDILVQIALDIQTAAGGGITSRERCEELCARYLNDEVQGLGLANAQARRRAPEIVESLISHFGILIERAPGDVSFVHLSLQEFLAAEGMTSMPETEQIKWLQETALQPRWRECLISWFGIQGESGRKPLAARAVRALTELAGAGEWERLQILSLRTELACADLGLPVGEARSIVVEAAREVELSPFSILRTALARNITAGALGGAVQAECGAAVAGWAPSRSYFERARLLRAFQAWKPAPDLGTTLRRGLLDERLECRRAAAESFAQVFGGDSHAEVHLVSLAHSHLQPEVRAAALHGLAQRGEWLEAARSAADRNTGSHAPELILVCAAVRVQMGQQTPDDLRKLRELLFTESLDYALRDDLTDVVSRGWPRDAELRAHSLQILEHESGTADFPFPLEYLLRNYRGDERIARTLANVIGRYGFHTLFDGSRFWNLLRESYRGHPLVVAAVREALTEYKKDFALILWDPHAVPAYLVLADDAARDELISGYSTADPHGRYWIAATLVKGWAEDPTALNALQTWAGDSPALAAPLAGFAQRLRPAAAERHRWLEDLVREADDRIVGRPIHALLTERPNEATRVLVNAQLTRPGLWYYNRVEVEANLAARYPSDPQSRSTVQRALAEIDGPPISVFAGTYQNDVGVRPQLLAAATPAPVDVRLAVGSVLQDRSAAPALIEQLTPAILAEETGAVRSAGLIARARACRHHPVQAGMLAEVLAEEAVALGTYMDRRRRSGLVALLELGELSRVVAIAKLESHLFSRFEDPLEPDVVSLHTLLENWPELQSALADIGVKVELPLAQLIDEGYGALLERVPALRAKLDLVLQSPREDWRRGHHLELLARRFPRSPVLCQTLVRELGRPFTGPWRSPANACSAARLLSDHFGGDENVLAELLRQELPETPVRPGAPGVLGYLVRGWPASEVSRSARAVAGEDRMRWPARDRLLCAIAWDQPAETEAAAREIVALRYRFGFASPENAELLRLWAKTDAARSVLAQWRDSADGDEAITALALAAEQFIASELDAEGVQAAFDRAVADASRMPLDGFDPLTGRVVSWSLGAYATLSNMQRL